MIVFFALVGWFSCCLTENTGCWAAAAAAAQALDCGADSVAGCSFVDGYYASDSVCVPIDDLSWHEEKEVQECYDLVDRIANEIADDTTTCKVVVNSLAVVYLDKRGGNILNKARDIFKRLKSRSKFLKTWSNKIRLGGLAAIDAFRTKYPRVLNQLRKEQKAFERNSNRFKKWTFQSDKAKETIANLCKNDSRCWVVGAVVAAGFSQAIKAIFNERAETAATKLDESLRKFQDLENEQNRRRKLLPMVNDDDDAIANDYASALKDVSETVLDGAKLVLKTGTAVLGAYSEFACKKYKEDAEEFRIEGKDDCRAVCSSDGSGPTDTCSGPDEAKGRRQRGLLTSVVLTNRSTNPRRYLLESCDSDNECDTLGCLNGQCVDGQLGDACDDNGLCRKGCYCAGEEGDRLCRGGTVGEVCDNGNDCETLGCHDNVCVDGQLGEKCRSFLCRTGGLCSSGTTDCNAGGEDCICRAGSLGDPCYNENDCVTMGCHDNVCVDGQLGEKCRTGLCRTGGYCSSGTTDCNAGGEDCICRAGSLGDPCYNEKYCQTALTCKDGKCTSTT